MGLIADAGFYYIGLLHRGRRVKCAAGGAGMVTVSGGFS